MTSRVRVFTTPALQLEIGDILLFGMEKNPYRVANVIKNVILQAFAGHRESEIVVCELMPCDDNRFEHFTIAYEAGADVSIEVATNDFPPLMQEP